MIGFLSKKSEREQEERHEAQWIDRAALTRLIEFYSHQLKFVVTGKSNLVRIELLVESLPHQVSVSIAAENIFSCLKR